VRRGGGERDEEDGEHRDGRGRGREEGGRRARRPPERRRGLIAVLGFLAMTGSLSINMYLPALADMAAELRVSSAAAQMTITACLVGLAAGQLVLGPLSDRLGRRRVLLGSAAAFCLAGFALVPASDLWLVCALRVVQGFAAAGGMAVARAVAADLTTGPATVRALSHIAMCVAVGPVLSPVAGGFLSEAVGWRGVFAVLGAVGLVMTVLCGLRVPESLPAARRRQGGAGGALRSFTALLRDGRFTAATVAYSFGFGCYMAYVSASPFIGRHLLGMTPSQFSIAFGISALSLLSANLLNARLAARTTPAVMLLVGVALTLSSSATLLALALTQTLSLPSFMGAAFVLCFGAGLVASNANALGFARSAEARGTGAALMGVSQFAVGGLATPLAGLGLGAPGVSMGLVCTLAAAVVLTAALVLALRRRD
jgi:DHA1 family bicyclomycin/chloramphenicol resistance-like MFS transporter